MKRFLVFLVCFSCIALNGYATATNRGTQTLEKLNEIIESVIRPGMGDYEKALALHDWLVDHVDYQLTSISSFHADSALLDGYGVCQSYTEAYNLLLGRAGLTCMSVQTGLHEWTVVLLDGAWYHIDVTWDDGTRSYLYFGIPDFAIEEVDSHATTGYCYSYQNNYAYREGYLNSFIKEYKEIIQGKLSQGKRNFTVTVTTSIANDDYNIMKRTAMIAVCDQMYMFEGNEQQLNITATYNNNDYQFLVDVDTPLLEKQEAPDASKFYDLSFTWDYPYSHCIDVRADVGGGSGGYICTIQVVDDEGNVFYDNGRAWSYLKDNDIYLPQGKYTVIVYETDGKTEITNHYQVDFSWLYFNTYLPDELICIESEAFSGSRIGSFVLCNSGLERIEDRAFENCRQIGLIEIPESVQFIADDAFSGCSTDLIVTGLPGSYIEEYCNKHGIHFNERRYN